jgi:hypothetical protein
MSSRLLHIALLTLVALLWTSGCASYSDSVRKAHTAVASSHPERAVEIINKQLEIKGSNQLPAELEDDNILLLLERATVLQSLGKYKLAARDMMAVDDQLEFLDLTGANSAELAKYMYSESSEDYRAPAYERLLLNTLNMVNFIAIGDLEGAKVEARRFTILEQFFLDNEEPAILSGILSLGNYVAGAVFEHSRDYQGAARYYSRAYFYGIRSPSFRDRLVDLCYLSGYKPRELQAENGKEALAEITEAVSINEEISFEEYRQKYMAGDTLVVVQTGLVPWRQAQRIPIVQAMGYTSNARHHSFESDHQVQLNMMVANGVIESVNFPMLTTRDIPNDKSISVTIAGTQKPIGADIDVASQVQTAYAHIMPGLMVAAITRLVTRVIAGQATEAAVDAAGGQSGLGFLAGLAVQGAMNAADTPDTRSWMTLPGRIRIVRTKLEAGAHNINVKIGNDTDPRPVTIHENSLNIVNFSRIR